MKTYGTFLCLAVLGIWAELPSTSGQDSNWKPGVCPRDNTICKRKDPDQCTTDADCKGQRKCCFNACAKRCVLPMKEKPGSCPLDATICPAGGPVLCRSDFECLGNQKCCSFECVVQCKNPV